ncbi:MAG: DEAD/DEAH box helicase [Candidatus Promineifilaceae bacterium]
MVTEFDQFNLHPQLVHAVSELGYEKPTPIQTAVIPLMLDGRDVIGQAQTGTGKTAAFSLPILHNLTPGQGQVQSLVVTPTRELAMQVAKSFNDYGRFRGVRVLAVYGGQPYGQQIYMLRKGVDVVVGTPGRLLDLIKRKVLDLGNVHTVVLDEADEMLSMGFIEDMEAILEETPSTRQTTLFSATVPPAIRRLAGRYLNDPQTVTIKHKQLTVAALEQRAYLVYGKDKLAALTRLFEVEEIGSALIFARTRIGTGQLANELTQRGFPAEALNGDLSQDAREQVLGRFRRNQIKVLVATDVAARGLDIDDISHVFNYDLPQELGVYVHRVGRTGRAGKTGIAISLVTPAETGRLRRIESFTKQTITRASLPTVSEIESRRQEVLLERMMVWLKRDRCRQERKMVMELVEQGHDPVEIAAAALKLGRDEEKQRPIAAVSEVKSSGPRNDQRNNHRGMDRKGGNGHASNGHTSNGRSRGSNTREKGMVRLSMSAGKAQGIRPNDVVGTIAYQANIPGYTIGAIRIQDQHTLVDVPEQYVNQVLDKAGAIHIHRKAITIERA